MNRRNFTGGAAVGLLLGSWASSGHALSLSDADAVSGLRAALERGAGSAVSLLGRTDGFLGNPKVRIPLPEWLERSAGLLRAAGRGHRVDELETAMNRAAEAAVPEAKALLVNAVKRMTVSDAKGILTGGDTSVTQFFADKTREPLGVKFLPIVTRATERVSLAAKYNRVAGTAAAFGLVKAEHANIEQYVTGKALDGLYLMIGEEEKKIRQDPVGTGSAILRRVFGALQ